MVEKILQGDHFTAAQVGEWEQVGSYATEFPGFTANGKLFLKDLLGMTGMEISMNVLPAGVVMPFQHQHKENEEVYIFVKGSGQFMVDGQEIPVQEGTVIRVGTEGNRSWRNNSTEDLYYIVIQAKEHSLTQATLGDGIVIPGRPDAWK